MWRVRNVSQRDKNFMRFCQNLVRNEYNVAFWQPCMAIGNLETFNVRIVFVVNGKGIVLTC